MIQILGTKQEENCFMCNKDKPEVFVIKSQQLSGTICPKHLMALTKGMQNGKQEAGLFDEKKS